MTQDFAKIRPEPLLERKPVQAPPAWSMMVTGVVVGMALGVFACVLLYLSGNVPALTAVPRSQEAVNNPLESTPELAVAEVEREELQLEFYTELPSYEVPVDAIPVDITEPEDPLPEPYILQSGAFQQRGLAEREVQRQQALGVNARVKAEALPGRTLFLVQSGPYRTHGGLAVAEQILRRNSINNLRLSAQ